LVYQSFPCVKVQPTAAKEDSRFEGYTDSEAANSALDGLYFAFESLRNRVCDF